jgi:hypothetical protein
MGVILAELVRLSSALEFNFMAKASAIWLAITDFIHN